MYIINNERKIIQKTIAKKKLYIISIYNLIERNVTNI